MIIPVNLAQDSYEILLEDNALANINQAINVKRKILLVTDDGIPKQYVDKVMQQCDPVFLAIVKQGEASKSFAEYKSLLKLLVKNQFTRSDAIIALGGGVVGDLAGFVAASYMRGIDFYNIPTTLLAQVDSSVGGKTAIDFCNLKNIVGAFHQPKKVIIDPLVLETLSRRETNAGLVEAIKMAATSDAKLFDLIKNNPLKENIKQIIADSLAIKIDIVQNDVKEKNLRKVLNFGHTVGHAIEVQSNYLHGECIGMGMLYFCSDQVRTKLIEILKQFNLPLKANLSVDKIFSAILHDKKTSGDEITIVYVPEIGSYQLIDLTLDECKAKLEESEQKIASLLQNI